MRLAVKNIADFDAIYHQFHRAVHANIFKMVRQAEAAEDILQEVFLTLWTNREKVGADKVAGWLFVVSYNKGATWLKRQIRYSFVHLEDAVLAEGSAASTPDDQPSEIYQLQLSLIEDAIRHLPKRKKEVFHLHYFEGRSYEEIAALLGISINSAKDYIKQSAGFIRKYATRNYDGSAAAIASLLVFGLYAS